MAPIHDTHPLAVLALRIFFLGVPGTIGLILCGWTLHQLPWIQRVWNNTPPSILQELCPGCGHRESKKSPPLSCTSCGLPPSTMGDHWQRTEQAGFSFVLNPILIGVAALGVFLLIGAVTETENILQKLIQVVVSLFLIASSLFVSLATYFQSNSKPKDLFYAKVNYQSSHPYKVNNIIYAEAQVRGGILQEANGSTLRIFPPADHPIVLDRLTSEESLVYRFLATILLQRLVSISQTQHLQWQLYPSNTPIENRVSYRSTPQQEDLQIETTTSRPINILYESCEKELPDFPWPSLQIGDVTRGVLWAICNLRSVEALFSLVQKDPSFQEHLQDALLELSFDLSPDTIEEKAGLLAASISMEIPTTRE